MTSKQMLATVEGVIALAHEQCSVDLTEQQASQFVRVFPDSHLRANYDWMTYRDTTSVGPVCWLKNRLREAGLLGLAQGAVDDDILPIVHVTVGGRLVARICEVARSRMFSTPRIVEPINWTAWLVAGQK